MDPALEVIEKAVQDAEDYQAHLEHNKEGLKMMKIVEQFLRDRKRLLYGGFAINALLPKKDQFYDPAKELPDYDFLTPDPYTDVAELIQRFTAAGYTEVEPTIGIHEGTYKVFVNFQGVADITFCDTTVYSILQKEAVTKDGLTLCPPNYLRMNMFVELSRPAGDVSRWVKVYKRFLLLDKAWPFQVSKNTHISTPPSQTLSSVQKTRLYTAFLQEAGTHGDVLLGIPDVAHIFQHPSQGPQKRAQTLKSKVGKGPFFLLALSVSPLESAKAVLKVWKRTLSGLELREVNPVGELLPSRVEILHNGVPLYMVFQTVACHAYYDVRIGRKTMRVASMDTLLQFYFAMYYAQLEYPGQAAILGLCKQVLDLAHQVRVTQNKPWPFPAFAVQCLGYQPTFAELKREHRERVRAEREKKKAEIKLRRSVKAASARLSAQRTKAKTKKRGRITAY